MISNRLLHNRQFRRHPSHTPSPGQVWAEQLRQAEAWKKKMEDWIDRHPATSLALALSVGVVLGWIVKRR